MIQFAWPWLFVLLPLPWLARLVLPPADPLAGRALRVPFLARIERAEGDARGAGLGHRPNLGHLVWALLVAAGAQPQWLDTDAGRPTTGRDLMLVVDVSGSMRGMDFSTDAEPLDRLGMVKRLAGRFVAEREGDRLGLILFGAKPYLRAPLTFDRATIGRLVDEAEIALAGEYTALGDALGLAVKKLRDRPGNGKVIVALTDGANNAGGLGPRQAARLAAESGIRIHAIGMGKAMAAGPNLSGPWSAEAEEAAGRALLDHLARSTGGRSFHALDAESLAEAWRALDTLEPAFGDDAAELLAEPLYPWPLGTALVLAAALVWRREAR